MALSYKMFDSPMRAEDIRTQGIDAIHQTTYGRRIASSTFKPAAFDAVGAGVFNDLLLESATDHLLQEDTSVLYLEDSSATLTSIIYIFSDQDSVYFAGSSEGKSSGSDLADLSVVFRDLFFRAGDVLTLEVSGQITANATNSSLEFTITFPDSGTAATVAMPTTVTQDTLSDWKLVVTSIFGYDSSGNGTVTHSGRLNVVNSTSATGESQSLMTYVVNTFDYNDVLYYKPQVAWNTTSAGSSTDFYSFFMTIS